MSLKRMLQGHFVCRFSGLRVYGGVFLAKLTAAAGTGEHPYPAIHRSNQESFFQQTVKRKLLELLAIAGKHYCLF